MNGQALTRVAIVNRGEAAMRLVNAVRELRHQSGRPMVTIALHTRAESGAMFVRESDEAVCLDDHRAADATGSAYLDLATLERALVASGADSAWVGWGFVAERPEFAELCERLGITFVGPRPAVMRALGDKIGSKLLAEQAGVPVAAWSGGAVDTIEDARRHASDIGYPLMIKATAGGGGRGIRRVDDESMLAEAFDSARSEGAKAFGDPTVFMERVVTDARHVEVQIIGDTHGTVWAVGVRDCSLQRRNQKVIEESHCTALTADEDAELRAAATRLARLAGYTNAGTVEFLYQPANRQFAFLEVNARLQVEHPVTELTTGLDLVKLQLAVAGGEALTGEAPETYGFAVEARLNAEDPQRDFAPAPGVIETLALPVGPGIRVDTGVAEGDVIPPEFDSMIAKVIAWGADRDEAIGRLHRALSQMAVVVRGGTTNKSFLLDLLERPAVRAGEVDTRWLDRLTESGGHLPTRLGEIAVVAAALDAADLLATVDREQFVSSARRGRPQARQEVGHAVELRHRGQAYRLVVRRVGARHYELDVDGCVVVVDRTRLGRARQRLTIDGRTYAVVSSVHGTDHLVEVDGVAHRCSRDDAGVVRAPAAALVVAVHVSPGDEVEPGDRIAVVEAMKMEIAITSPVSGRVREVLVAGNTQVDAGAPLVRIDAATGGDEGASGARLDLGSIGTPASAGRPDPGLAAVRAYVLGFDVPPDDARRRLAATRASGDHLDEGSVLGVLDAVADLSALAPESVGVIGDQADESAATREHFSTYLRTLDVERENVPASFPDRLQRALTWYGISSLDRSAELEDALSRIFTAQSRRSEQLPVVTELLEELLAAAETGSEAKEGSARLRETLDRLVAVTRRRSSALASLAHTVRFHCFDRPHIDRARGEVRARIDDILRRLIAEGPDSIDAADREELIGCPLALFPIVAAHNALRVPGVAGVLLDILTRRFYRIRALDDVRPFGGAADPDGTLLHATYRRSDRTVHVIAGCVGDNGVADALARVQGAAAVIDPADTVVVDLYVTTADTDDADPDTRATELASALALAGLPQAIRRVTMAVCARSAPAATNLTFRRTTGADRPYWMPDDAGHEFTEDRKFRGLHPMVARRLQMWRLSEFEIVRLPADGDVNLFDCVARTNESDRRLVAVAEVRDLTPVRDDDGRLVTLPEVEQVLVSCISAIRSSMAAQPPKHRTGWNRVMLYVWPVVDLPTEDVQVIARRLAPLTEGIGIEQIVVSARFANPEGEPTEVVLRLSNEPGRGLTIRFTEPPTAPMQPLDDYTRKLVQTRRRGLVYPYELAPELAGRGGRFVEYDLVEQDGRDTLEPVERTPGANRAGVVVGLVSTPTGRYPEGITRVALLGDPTRAMGAITEHECRRILAAIDLAERLDAPIEWFALSAGAKIAMDSGSENLDWVARVLRRLVEHTQRGGEVNVVVAGINVGAQPYWNAEATMLMHTKGILVMTPDSAMVLTGKQAIDYSGGVSAEDNLGIGGYARIMGPNGEAQYWAPNLSAACAVLRRHYDLTYRAPGERWPRRATTTDPGDRDVRVLPHAVEGSDFATVGDVFSAVANPDRKKPFDIRTVMRAVADRDHDALERWPQMAEAEMAVVHDARLGGLAVTMVGIESRPLPRHGLTPADGPGQWSAGTLFPLSSKKVARAINAASGSRPVVILANLSGFDGSPESLRRLQLEYGAEIGRAIVNFDGPIVLCVVSRYHGGAFVVFSATLNDNMEVLAVEGSFASVIGGAPAAAVVFTGEVDARTRADDRVRALDTPIVGNADAEVRRRAELAEVRHAVRTEKLGEVAAEFDAVHSVERAKAVGSVHRIVPADRLRAELIAAVERGMARIDSGT